MTGEDLAYIKLCMEKGGIAEVDTQRTIRDLIDHADMQQRAIVKLHTEKISLQEQVRDWKNSWVLEEAARARAEKIIEQLREALERIAYLPPGWDGPNEFLRAIAVKALQALQGGSDA